MTDSPLLSPQPKHIATQAPTKAFARFAANLRFDELPADVIAQARQSMLDVLGIAFAGAAMGEGCDEVAEYAKSTSSGGPSSLWISGDRVPAGEAALANATYARALDYDDIIEFPQIHVTACVVPAAIAVAQMPAAYCKDSGKRLLTAIVCGSEIQTRLAAALAPQWGEGLPVMLASQILGYFSAAAACGHVLSLDESKMQSALGLAQMQSAGTEEMIVHAAASIGKSLYAGLCNQGGVQSALMASAGVVARGEPLTGKAGMFAALFQNRYSSGVLTAGLGEEFTCLRRNIKAMPGTLVSHAFAEAARYLVDTHGLADADIAVVKLHVGPWGTAMSEPQDMRRNPPSASAAMNSIPFVVATALAHGAVSLGDFAAQGRTNAKTLAMSARVEHIIDRSLANRAGLEPGIVTIECVDGRSFTHRVDVPRGHPLRPLSFEDVANKFRRNVTCGSSPRSSQQINNCIDAITHIEDMQGADIDAFIASLSN